MPSPELIGFGLGSTLTHWTINEVASRYAIRATGSSGTRASPRESSNPRRGEARGHRGKLPLELPAAPGKGKRPSGFDAASVQ